MFSGSDLKYEHPAQHLIAPDYDLSNLYRDYVRCVCIPSLLPHQVEFRVGETAPARPVAEKAWLKTTGMLPLGQDPAHDIRGAAAGGCDSPVDFDGCHVYYIKVGSKI